MRRSDADNETQRRKTYRFVSDLHNAIFQEI
jgi:hypothetical protein